MLCANELGIINYYKSKGDFNRGSIWKYIYDIKKKELVYGIYIVDNDEYVQKLNDEIQEPYSSYYNFYYKGKDCLFDEEQEKRINAKCLNYWIGYKKLDEINNGSLEINDKLKEKGIYNYI